MKKICALLFLSCFIPTTSFAQTSVWKVTNKKGNTLYLGGTVHLLSPSDYPLPKEFNQAYKKADILAIEADIEQMENPEIAQSFMPKMMYSGEKSLTTVLDSTTYQLLEKACNKLHIPLANLHKLKPSLVIISLTGIKMQAAGITAEGVDKHFLGKAKKDNKDILFLESVESQIDLVANMGAGNENNFVKKSLEDLNKTEAIMGDLISNWRSGTSTFMDQQITDLKNDYPKLHHNLLVKRNNNWIPKIESYFATKKIEFILMGALHLHGEPGILHQLKKRGYTIKQL